MDSRSEALKCENCGQPVLSSDIECWHCGAALAKLVPDTPSLEEHLDEEEERTSEPPLQILFYAAMTVMTALALLFVIRSLGRQPRLAAGLGLDDKPAAALVAPDGSFSIEIPAEMVWYFPQARRGRSAAARHMASDPQFEAALQPLLGLASDTEIILVGQVDSTILSVAQSGRLSQLTVENVVSSLPSEDFSDSIVLSTRKGESTLGPAAIITVEQEDPPLVCRQHFMPDSGGAYLAATCTEPGKFEQHSAAFDTILASFSAR